MPVKKRQLKKAIEILKKKRVPRDAIKKAVENVSPLAKARQRMLSRKRTRAVSTEEEYITVGRGGQYFRVRKSVAEGMFTPEDEQILRELHGESHVYEGPIREEEAIYHYQVRARTYKDLNPEEREYLNKIHNDPHYVDKKIKEEEEHLKRIKKK